MSHPDVIKAWLKAHERPAPKPVASQPPAPTSPAPSTGHE